MEGLKRLYIVFSLLVVVASAAAIWIDSRPMCSDYAAISDDELLASLPTRSSFNAQTTGINPETVMWDKPECITKAQRLGRTALGAAVAGGVLLILWLIFRWIIAGFLPARKGQN